MISCMQISISWMRHWNTVLRWLGDFRVSYLLLLYLSYQTLTRAIENKTKCYKTINIIYSKHP